MSFSKRWQRVVRLWPRLWKGQTNSWYPVRPAGSSRPVTQSYLATPYYKLHALRNSAESSAGREGLVSKRCFPSIEPLLRTNGSGAVFLVTNWSLLWINTRGQQATAGTEHGCDEFVTDCQRFELEQEGGGQA